MAVKANQRHEYGVQAPGRARQRADRLADAKAVSAPAAAPCRRRREADAEAAGIINHGKIKVAAACGGPGQKGGRVEFAITGDIGGDVAGAMQPGQLSQMAGGGTGGLALLLASEVAATLAQIAPQLLALLLQLGIQGAGIRQVIVSPEVPLSVVSLEPSRFKGEAALSFKAFRQADMHTTKDERIPKDKTSAQGI